MDNNSIVQTLNKLKQKELTINQAIDRLDNIIKESPGEFLVDISSQNVDDIESIGKSYFCAYVYDNFTDDEVMMISLLIYFHKHYAYKHFEQGNTYVAIYHVVACLSACFMITSFSMDNLLDIAYKLFTICLRRNFSYLKRFDLYTLEFLLSFVKLRTDLVHKALKWVNIKIKQKRNLQDFALIISEGNQHICELFTLGYILHVINKHDDAARIFSKCLDLCKILYKSKDGSRLYYARLHIIAKHLSRCDSTILSEKINEVIFNDKVPSSHKIEILINRSSIHYYSGYVLANNTPGFKFHVDKSFQILNQLEIPMKYTHTHYLINAKRYLINLYALLNDYENVTNDTIKLYLFLNSLENFLNKKDDKFDYLIAKTYLEINRNLDFYLKVSRRFDSKFFIAASSYYDNDVEKIAGLDFWNKGEIEILLNNSDEKNYEILFRKSLLLKSQQLRHFDTKLLQKSLKFFLKSRDLLMQTLVYYNISRGSCGIMYPDFSSPCTSSTSRDIRNNIESAFMVFRKMIMFEYVSLTMDNINLFFKNLEEYLAFYQAYSKKDELYIYSQVIEFVVDYARVLISKKQNDLCEKYLEQVQSLGMIDTFDQHMNNIHRHMGINYYLTGQFEKALDTFMLSFNIDDMDDISYSMYYITPIYKSYLKLFRLNEAEAFLLQCQNKLSEIDYQDEMYSHWYLPILQESITQLLVDLALKTNDSTKALLHLQSLTYTDNHAVNYEYGTELCEIELERFLNDDRHHVIKTNCFDMAHLKMLRKIKHANNFVELIVIVYGSGYNGKIRINSTNQIEKFESVNRIVYQYFKNENLKSFSNKSKYIVFNIFEDKAGQVQLMPTVQKQQDKDFLKCLADIPDSNLENTDQSDYYYYLNDIFVSEYYYKVHEDYQVMNTIKSLELNMANKIYSENVDSYECNFQLIGLTKKYNINYQDNILNVDENMNSNRICIILCSTELFNDKYVDSNQIRVGDKFDRMFLAHRFIKMKYKVELLFDLSSTEIKQYFENFNNDDKLINIESVILFVLHHGGKDDVIKCCDDKIVDLHKDILKPLYNSNYLKNKQKIIFVSACRGDRTDFFKPGHKLSSPFCNDLIYEFCDLDNFCDYNQDNGDEQIEREPVDNSQLYTNMVICFSAIKGFVSYRDPTSGTFFIQSLIKALDSFDEHVELFELLAKTHHILINEFPPKNKIKADMKIPKQSTEIFVYNWRNVFYVK